MKQMQRADLTKGGRRAMQAPTGDGLPPAGPPPKAEIDPAEKPEEKPAEPKVEKKNKKVK